MGDPILKGSRTVATNYEDYLLALTSEIEALQSLLGEIPEENIIERMDRKLARSIPKT
ncbi:MAG: hypothetical protein RDU20_22285 [Desulfomonilaceae bacterium]|nr:hypothetical protein [Desulfomonilaceae bacterium]